jgi:sarcosine oxidase subunit alpha
MADEGVGRRIAAPAGAPAPRKVRFSFNGRRHPGEEGDTIASALAADGVDVLAHSFKYHRPRGLLCCSGRCPNCMVDVDGQPNVRACVTPLADGMKVRPQNAWPSLRFDLLSLTDRFDRLLPVGFYYKTFIRPRFLWPLYELVLRHAAGLGKVDPKGHPDLHQRRLNIHADVMVIGGGPAGCLAALEASAAGAQVVLVDDQQDLGGHLRTQSAPVEGDPRLGGASGRDAAAHLAALVAAEGRIRHLAGATAVGLYEDRLVAVSQGETFIHVRAGQIVVATGAAERPVLFNDNDRPGIMLASGILRLRWLHGVRIGRRATVVTDDDHGWRQADELLAAGFEVAALLDARPDSTGEPPEGASLREAGVAIHWSAIPVQAHGRRRVSSLRFTTTDGELTVATDLVALAPRPEAVFSLLGHEGVRARWDDGVDEFLPGDLPEGVHAAGHVNGPVPDALAATEGVLVGRAAASNAGFGPHDGTAERLIAHEQAVADAFAATPRRPPLARPGGRKQFICVCEDVTVKELQQGAKEGFTSLELMKRYSTVTMGPCQGKQCHSMSARVQAQITDSTPAQTGLTTSRPPFQPVTLAALAGPHLARVRRTAMHDRHAALKATWTDMGDWKRPLHYGDVAAECRAVHQTAGIIDVSTLGKLDVQGADAGEFLDWLHPNRFSDLKVGRVRYRAMLDDAGIILDDGAVARLGEQRFFLSTTTGNLDAVDQWLGWWLAGGSRRVGVTDVTGHYAAVNLAGPNARQIMGRLTSLDVSREGMPYLAAVEGMVADVPAIILRIGFVGEVGYEIHVPADYGAHLWDALMDAGRDLGIRPFGVEAQRVLRLEKQHAIVGQDTDALSNPVEASMGWLVKADKPDFIGRDASVSVLARGPRQILTGIEVIGAELPTEGASILRDGSSTPIGRVTSAKWSHTLDKGIALGWVDVDDAAEGTRVTLRLGVGKDGGTTVGRVRTKPFYDPTGERLRA